MSGHDFAVHTLGPLEGKRIPGGCLGCDAYQTVKALEPGLWDITVYHDDVIGTQDTGHTSYPPPEPNHCDGSEGVGE